MLVSERGGRVECLTPHRKYVENRRGGNSSIWHHSWPTIKLRGHRTCRKLPKVFTELMAIGKRRQWGRRHLSPLCIGNRLSLVRTRRQFRTRIREHRVSWRTRRLKSMGRRYYFMGVFFFGDVFLGFRWKVSDIRGFLWESVKWLSKEMHRWLLISIRFFFPGIRRTHSIFIWYSTLCVCSRWATWSFKLSFTC